MISSTMELCLIKANNWLKRNRSSSIDDAVLLRDPELIKGLLAIPSVRSNFSQMACNMAVDIHNVSILIEFSVHGIYPTQNAYTWLFEPMTIYSPEERAGVLAWFYWCTNIRPTKDHLDHISPILEYDKDFLDMLDEFGWEWKFSDN